MFFCCLLAYVCCTSSAFSHVLPYVPLSDGCRICSLWQQNDNIQKFCLPHSSTFFCIVCVTLLSFSSISLYFAPSFCRFLYTFVLERFCRYCRCSSRVAAVFSVPRPLRSAFRASRCYLCAPFAFFLLLFGVLLFFLCLALFVLLSVLLADICARPLPSFLLLSAILFNKHRTPAICSTGPRTART